MDLERLAEFLPALAMGIALAAAAGLRAWLPMLAAGGLARLGVLELGPTFRFLASDKALVIFAIATVIELVGDKIPAVDHALDMLGTPLRPLAGAVLAASVLGAVTDPLTASIVGIAVGAPTALVPHVAKSALRAVSTTATAGLANPALSFVEDAVTVVLLILAVLIPIVVVALVGLTLYFTARWLRRKRPLARAA
jgi:Domain of unknown function (DUF4126)